MTRDAIDYSDVATVRLQEWIEADRWRLSSIDAQPEGWAFAEETRAFVVLRIRAMGEEVARRKRLRDRPGAPGWPAQVDRTAAVAALKAAMPLEQVVARLAPIQFERHGRQLWCICPLPGHDEDHASFSVDPDKQLWHCWGCRRGGDVFSFAEHFLGLERFDTACQIVAGAAGVPWPPAAPKGAARQRPAVAIR